MWVGPVVHKSIVRCYMTVLFLFVPAGGYSYCLSLSTLNKLIFEFWGLAQLCIKASNYPHVGPRKIESDSIFLGRPLHIL